MTNPIIDAPLVRIVDQFTGTITEVCDDQCTCDEEEV